ncbi:hypothetical protein BOO92_18390 [Vibrio navarrensis]|uniref:hypothetical protein n=1 Tax=Vibrio navarrensis TaxID=29495 RepID=UPI0018662D59|nr:hypothetical protein [Vibrio navarrensis]MBE3658643.1 hypothetical protein [Vibrio navarrensis]MBH9740027.1 hypothetical protein [Vibrio navarrensis]HAS6100822.1 hypothetical protein [Vibrio vulnificus]HDY8121370.1 hypothetical protein [Vibrio vulnificus]
MDGFLSVPTITGLCRAWAIEDLNLLINNDPHIEHSVNNSLRLPISQILNYAEHRLVRRYDEIEINQLVALTKASPNDFFAINMTKDLSKWKVVLKEAYISQVKLVLTQIQMHLIKYEIDSDA